MCLWMVLFMDNLKMDYFIVYLACSRSSFFLEKLQSKSTHMATTVEPRLVSTRQYDYFVVTTTSVNLKSSDFLMLH